MKVISMKEASLWTGLLLALVLSLTSISAAAAETVLYVHTDHLGTPIVWTDEDGNVVKTREYEPYGYVVNGPLENGPGYTGHVEDAASGLVYMQQRYYDPAIGEPSEEGIGKRGLPRPHDPESDPPVPRGFEE